MRGAIGASRANGGRPRARRNRATRPGPKLPCGSRPAVRRYRSPRASESRRARSRGWLGSRRSVQRPKTPANTRKASGCTNSWKTGSTAPPTGRRRSGRLRAEAWIVANERAVRLRAASARASGGHPGSVPGPAAFQLVAHAQFHVAGGGVREGDRHDTLHRRPRGNDFHHTLHQRRGLARAGGGFHHPTAVEIGDGNGVIALRWQKKHRPCSTRTHRWDRPSPFVVCPCLSEPRLGDRRQKTIVCPTSDLTLMPHHLQPRISFKPLNSTCDFSFTRSSS